MNKTATVRATISYVNAEGQSVSLPAVTIECPYQAHSGDTFDIPDTTAAGDFEVPFGSIAKATAVLVENHTGQPVDISVNSGDLEYTALADGKSVLIALPMMPGGSPITEVKVTTGATQVGDGSIGYHVFGDPT